MFNFLLCRLKYAYNYFSSHFCFLGFVVLLFVHKLFLSILLLLTAAISLSLLFSGYTQSPWIVASTQFWMQTSHLPLSFSTHKVCLYHLSEVKPCASSSITLFFDPFVIVLLSSISRKVQSTLQGSLLGYLFNCWDFYFGVWFQKVFLLSGRPGFNLRSSHTKDSKNSRCLLA